MDDSLGMGVGHRIENGAHDADGLDRWQGPTLRQEFREVLAWHVFEHEVEIPSLLACLENRHDTGMAHAPDSPRFG
ncbi:hypothetical protein SDC9_148766 [bioreactor metagenome]|uniref:Uncharacterized protein n=1 Tax=bioreactor metagenome TaxID=1076179 RepID=A0A645EIH3_9ZZZZ